LEPGKLSEASWVLKEKVSKEQDVLVYEEVTDMDQLITRVGHLQTITHANECYARFPTLRLLLWKNGAHELWIDVSYFTELDQFYIVGTIRKPLLEVTDQEVLISDSMIRERFGLTSPAPSNVVAFLHATNSELFARIKDANVPDDLSFFSPASLPKALLSCFNVSAAAPRVYNLGTHVMMMIPPSWADKVVPLEQLWQALRPLPHPLELKRRFLYRCAETGVQPDFSKLEHQLNSFDPPAELLWDRLKTTQREREDLKRGFAAGLRVLDFVITHKPLPDDLDTFVEHFTRWLELALNPHLVTENMDRTTCSNFRQAHRYLCNRDRQKAEKKNAVQQ